MADPMHAPLSRRLNLPLLTFYGLGTTIGAGIFVLVGRVAGRAGMWAPVSFLVASLLAAFTAFSFAELVARYPRSAGEAIYVREGLRSHRLALAVGLMVALSGIVSSATIVSGSVGYLNEFVALPHAPGVFLMLALLTGLAVWGIGQSVTVAAVFTVLEIGGLVLVIWAAKGSFMDLPARAGELLPPLDGAAWIGIMAGAMLAFYAFLGFEDLVNVAEEAKDVTRTMPLAILLTLVVTTLLYTLVSLVAVLTVAPAELAGSRAPLAMIYERGSGGSGGVVSAIAVFAVLNGALIQMIMASRVLYGLADQGELPVLLAWVHPRLHTPLVATGLVAAAILVLALGFRLEGLAELTSVIVLVVFALVNLALVAIKRRGDPAPPGVRVYPVWIPIVGFTVSTGFLALQLLR
ncbi:MAG: amino acid permease [Alphaproteobacteria bacterium]|nr:amino acid permease [Alphaproteobacteria bacterium]